MNEIEQMLIGKMEMQEFINLLKTSESLRAYIRNLVPQEAIHCPEHVFWQNNNYSSIMSNDFDFLHYLFWICRFDGSMGDNLGISDTLWRAYSYYNPTLCVTSKYRDLFRVYLDVVGDYYDAPEVRSTIEKIILEAISIRPKIWRKKVMKKQIATQFHIEGKNYPQWIQGSEWPMGVKTPMQFVMQKEGKESVEYQFVDVDTGETRTIKQYY